MTTDQIAISAILLIAFVMFSWSRWRYDLVAMFSLVVAVLIISQGLQSAGVVGLISEQIN